MHLTAQRLRRLAGGFALAHVVLISAGISLQSTPRLGDGVAGIEDDYVAGSLSRTFAGGLVEAFGFLLLLPTLVYLARAFGRRSEAGRWAAQSGLQCGTAYVAVSYAVGFPAGAAAMYGAQHGLDPEVALAINNVRNIGYFLSLLLLAGSTLGISLSALADGLHHWVGRLGLLTGVLLLASAPLAAVGQQDWGTLVWMVWFVGVAVLLIRLPADHVVTADSTG